MTTALLETVAEDVRDAGPIDLDDLAVGFEDAADADREHTACLADPWVTATTRVACD